MNNTQDSASSTVNTLKEGYSPVSFNKSDIRQQPLQRTDSFGLEYVAQALQNKHRTQSASNKAEAREQELSEVQRAKLDQAAGKSPSKEYSDIQRTAYDVAKYTDESSSVLSNTLHQMDFDDMHENLKPEQIAETQDGMIDTIHKAVASYGVGEHEGAMKVAVLQIRSVKERFEAEKIKYNTETLPARTIGVLVDSSIKYSATKEDWDNTIKLINSADITGEMDSELRDKTVIGEIKRATEAENLSAVPSLKGSDIWERMSATQKQSVNSAYGTAVVKWNNKQINKFAGVMIKAYTQSVDSGNTDHAKEAEKLLVGLPDNIAEPVHTKTQNARENYEEVMRVYYKMEQHNADKQAGVQFSKADAGIAAKLVTSRLLNKAKQEDVELLPQVATQRASLELHNMNMITKDTQGAFNMNGKLVNGLATAYQLRAFQGMEALSIGGLDDSQLSEPAGEDNASKFLAIRRRVQEQGQSIHSAFGSVLDNEAVEFPTSKTESILKELSKEITEVDQRNWFEIIGGVLDDAVSILPYVGSYTPDNRTELDKVGSSDRYSEVAIDANTFLNWQSNGIARHVQTGVQQAYVDFRANNTKFSEEDKVHLFEKKLGSSVISNRRPIMNTAVNTKLKNAVNGDNRRASRYMTEATQILSSMLTLPTSVQDAAYREATDVYKTGEDGQVVQVMDNAEKHKLLRTRPESIVTKFNENTFNRIAGNGFTSYEGLSVRPFKEMASENVGRWDSGEATKSFQTHSIQYGKNTSSFIMQGLTPTGGDLAFEQDVVDRVRVNGEWVDVPEYYTGQMPTMVIPEQMMFDVMRSLSDNALRKYRALEQGRGSVVNLPSTSDSNAI